MRLRPGRSRASTPAAASSRRALRTRRGGCPRDCAAPGVDAASSYRNTGRLKRVGDLGADLPGERDAVGHRHAFDRDERARRRRRRAADARPDGCAGRSTRQRFCKKRQHGCLEAGWVAREGQDRAVVRRVRLHVEHAHSPQWLSGASAIAGRPRTTAFADVRNALDDRHVRILAILTVRSNLRISSLTGSNERWPGFNRGESMMKLVFRCLLIAAFVATSGGGVCPTGADRNDSGRSEGCERRVLPGVTVTLTSEDRGFSRSTVTDENGRYVFPAVPIGQLHRRSDAARIRDRSQSTDNLVETERDHRGRLHAENRRADRHGAGHRRNADRRSDHGDADDASHARRVREASRSAAAIRR